MDIINLVDWRQKMIYRAKNKELYNHSVKLTNKEEKMLFLLTSNELLTFDELDRNGFNKSASRAVKSRLVEKTYLKIDTVKEVGYRLRDEIEFE